MNQIRKKGRRPPNRASGVLKGLDRRYDTQSGDTVDVGVLETFPNEYPDRETIVDIETEEFTAVCPYSGLPDFGIVRIEYVPGDSIIELRSLKYYLFSYRNVGIFQEHLVNRILDDLCHCCNPAWMRITADYNIRGGVHTVASVERGKRPKERAQ